MHSGQTDRLTNTMDISSLPTIWDRLNAKGVSAAYYFSDLPLLALWGTKYVTSGNILPHATFLTQAALGQLPSVSYVEPRFLGEGNQVSNDDHPAADVRDGQAFVNGIYEALRQSPNWEKTLLIVNYDEWGGFYDHVVPPFGPVSDAERALGNDGRLGFRVPCMLIGPRAPKRICNLPFDPQSILNLITWRFGLDPVGSRADWSLNMALALDFDHLRTDIAPSFNTGIGPYGRPCGTPLDSVFSQIPQLPVLSSSNKAHFDEWQQLKELAIRYGLPMVP
jgi:phospholipase C